MMNNKQANLLDWFYIIVIVFATGICVYVGHIMLNNPALTKLWEDEGVTDVTVKSQNAINSFDNIMLFVIVGLSIFVLISSAVITTHVAFFIISIVMLAISVTFSAIMSNTFWTFSNSSQVAAAAAAFPKITFLMQHFPVYIGVLGMVCAIVAVIGYKLQ